jgi:DNA-binding response OmpR family regulator
MPRVDGFEALKRLKGDDATSDVPVIMVTAKGRPEDLAMARNLGARDYINKPWAEGEVEMRVDWALSATSRV